VTPANPFILAALCIGTWALVLAPVFVRYRFRQRHRQPVARAIATPVRRPAAIDPGGATGARPFDSALALGDGHKEDQQL
jgi:hypothetical protein